MIGRNREPRNPCCPRCRYDQRGVAATWVDSCPMLGRCAECGLEFEWPQVFHPEKFEPRWCVEFTPRRRSFPLACIKTFVRSFWPWGFWSRLRMSFPIRTRRLGAYSLAPLLALLMCYAIGQGTVAAAVRYRLQQYWIQAWAALPGTIQRYQSQIQTVLANPDQYRQQLRSKDPAAVDQYIQMLQAEVTALQTALASPPTPIPVSYVHTVAQAIVMPLSSQSPGTITIPFDRAYPYPPPNTLYMVLFNQGQFGFIGGRPLMGMATASASWLFISVVLVVLLPGSLILLPVSRRRAKVRWGHIGRVMAYSTFIPVSVIVLCSVLLGLGMIPGRVGDVAQWCFSLATRIGIPLMLVLWWGAAISRYLKIRHGMFTAATLLVLSGLVVMVAMWFIAPRLLIEGRF